MTASDPFGGFVRAGVGWLAEPVSLLREPLDALHGDADEVAATVDSLRHAATQMRQLAQEHREDLTTVAEWQGQAGDTYTESLSRLAEELESLGVTLDGTATVVGVSGTLVTRLRGIAFGVVSGLVTELTRHALIATAAGPATSGGSLAAVCGMASTRAAITAADLTGRITTLVDDLDRQSGRLDQLAVEMSRLTDGLARFHQATVTENRHTARPVR